MMTMAASAMRSLRATSSIAASATRATTVTASMAPQRNRRTLATTNSEFLSAGPRKAEREYERAVQQAREVFQHTRAQLVAASPSPASQASLSQALNQLNHDVALAKQRYLFATLNATSAKEM